MTLGEIIKKFRLSCEEEMSIRRFASLSGLSPAYVSMLERGTDQRGNVIAPTIQTIDKVAKTMNVSFNDLFNQISGNVIVNASDAERDNTEIELLSMYRKLTDNRKNDVFNYVKMLYDNESK